MKKRLSKIWQRTIGWFVVEESDDKIEAGLKVIAVGGAGEKALVVNYLGEILKEASIKVHTFNSSAQVTVKDIKQFLSGAKRAGAEYAVLEVSSQLLNQKALASTQIYMAVMTSLAIDRPIYHASMENYVAAESRLLGGEPNFIVLNRDDVHFSALDQFTAAKLKINYGENQAASVRIGSSKFYKKGAEAHLLIDGKSKLEVATYSTDKRSVSAMAAAVAAATLLGLSKNTIQEGIANYEPTDK
jgi:UDP-N-acetylmuramyl tripeptide synthase